MRSRYRSRYSRLPCRRPAGIGGNATLEMVIVGVLLFYTCFATVEFGYYFFTMNVLQAASREGCRAAIVAGATNQDVTNAVVGQLKSAGLIPSNALIASPYVVTTTPADITTVSAGSAISVSVNSTWGTIGSGFRPMKLIGTSKIIAGSSAMRAESNGTSYSAGNNGNGNNGNGNGNGNNGNGNGNNGNGNGNGNNGNGNGNNGNGNGNNNN